MLGKTTTFALTGYRMGIEVNVEKGLLIPEDRSATGKTYLCNLLKRYKTYGEPVLGISYTDYINDIDIRNCLRDKPKLIMIDRYDMFCGAFDEELIEASKNAVVVVDLKEGSITDAEQTCELSLKGDKIEINPFGTRIEERANERKKKQNSVAQWYSRDEQCFN